MSMSSSGSTSTSSSGSSSESSVSRSESTGSVSSWTDSNGYSQSSSSEWYSFSSLSTDTSSSISTESSSSSLELPWHYSEWIYSADPYSQTTRIQMSVTGIKPFVYNNNKFVQVASVADMHLLPEDTGTLNRRSTVDLMFRTSSVAYKIRDLIVADLLTLEPLFNDLSEADGTVFFNDCQESVSESSEGESSTVSSSEGISESSSFLS